ncbi:hypothetical protein MHBO_002098 [Bonamia ostreae]|uniref:40S ribosomal protein S21 n=1 Tax=Bonamia ostreae TaxID=126728 RepID=A0ABV2AL73_9EUKA
MENNEGTIVDKYVPRKCYLTNRIITSKDHASVQLEFALLDEDGIYRGQSNTLVLSGYARKNAASDGAINKFLQENDMIEPLFD